MGVVIVTLDEMLQQCATDLDETLTKSANGTYEGEALALAQKIMAGINYAYHKIAREKHVLTRREAITLDERRSFDFAAFPDLIKLFNVYDKHGFPVYWIIRNQTIGYFPDSCAGDELTAEISYLPPRLTLDDLNASPLFPETRVDHMVLCYYADFYVLSLEPDNETREKAATFLGLFNDGYANIRQDISEIMTFRVE